MSIKVDPDWWRTLFDEVYLKTDARSVCNEELSRREVDVICRMLPIDTGHSVLDLCGGQGRHSIELTARGAASCTVIDYSDHLVKVGRETASDRGLNVEFRQGDARETGLAANVFDHVIIMGNSMGYLPEDDDDLKILREAHRLLKTGSWILVDVADGEKVRSGLDPNAWHEIDDDLVVCRHRELDNGRVKAREMVFSRQDGLLRDQTYSIRVFEPDTLATTLSTAGFSDVKVHRDFSPHEKEGDYGFMNRRVLVTGRKR
jgi:D-alanine-D-alanine ligase